jgi:hypothetical protein
MNNPVLRTIGNAEQNAHTSTSFVRKLNCIYFPTIYLRHILEEILFVEMLQNLHAVYILRESIKITCSYIAKLSNNKVQCGN